MSAGAQLSSTTQQAHINSRATLLTRSRLPQPHQTSATNVDISASQVVALSGVPTVRQYIARRAAPVTSACARTNNLRRSFEPLTSTSASARTSARQQLPAPRTYAGAWFPKSLHASAHQLSTGKIPQRPPAPPHADTCPRNVTHDACAQFHERFHAPAQHLSAMTTIHMDMDLHRLNVRPRLRTPNSINTFMPLRTNCPPWRPYTWP